MSNNNLTLLGEEPYKKAFNYIHKFDSKEDLERNVAKLFLYRGDSFLIMSPPSSGHGWDGSGIEAIDYCLKSLPAGHELVQEILTRADIILKDAPKMSALELKVAACDYNQRLKRSLSKKSRYPRTSLYLAFYIGSEFHPEIIFHNLENAAYRVIDEFLADEMSKPYGTPIGSAVFGMSGYADVKPKEILKFADLLHEKSIYTGTAICLYAELVNEKAIIAFIDAVRKNNLVDLAFIGPRIRNILAGKHNYSDDAFKKHICGIDDPILREKVAEYFKIGVK